MSIKRMFRRIVAHGAFNTENPVGVLLRDEYLSRATYVWILFVYAARPSPAREG